MEVKKELLQRGKQLFDVFCEDDTRREELEKYHGVPMQQLDRDYLMSMRIDRKGRCTNVDKQWHIQLDKSVSKKKKREERQNMNSTTVFSTQIDDTDDDQFSETSSVEDRDEQSQGSVSSNEEEPTSSSNKKRRFVKLQNLTAPFSPVKTRHSSAYPSGNDSIKKFEIEKYVRVSECS